jgi:DNA polymerase III epsilon subunit-like protein
MGDRGNVHFFDRLIAMTDVETTGTDPDVHEIIDIGLVLADPATFEVVTAWGQRVRPTRPDLMSEETRGINGYDPDGWRDAVSVETALRAYVDLTEGAVFHAWNVTFDWSFVKAGLRRAGIAHRMDYHRICTYSIAVDRLRAARLPSTSMDPVAMHLGLGPEAKPHGALNGARKALEIYRHMVLGG